jgi:hypothetical protein
MIFVAQRFKRAMSDLYRAGFSGCHLLLDIPPRAQ